MQEALIAASAQWPRDGVPDSPRAWLVQVAGAALHRPGAVGCRAPPSRGARRGPRTHADADPGGRRHPHALPALLPPGAGAARAGRAHAPGGRRTHDRRDRPRAARARGDGRPAHLAGEGTHPRERRGLPDAAGRRARRPPRRTPQRALPDLHRGPHGQLGGVARSRRPVGRGDPPHAAAARRGTGCLGRDDRAARAHAPHRRAPGRTRRRRGRARAARRAGPLPLGPRDDRRGRRPRHRGARSRADRAVPAAGRDRRRARRGRLDGGHRLDRDPRPLRPARPARARARW